MRARTCAVPVELRLLVIGLLLPHHGRATGSRAARAPDDGVTRIAGPPHDGVSRVGGSPHDGVVVAGSPDLVPGVRFLPGRTPGPPAAVPPSAGHAPHHVRGVAPIPAHAGATGVSAAAFPGDPCTAGITRLGRTGDAPPYRLSDRRR